MRTKLGFRRNEIRMGWGSTRPTEPFSVQMTCEHDGFHAIQTAYDRSTGVLVYFWVCERCGARLCEARRETYRPAFNPAGNQVIARQLVEVDA
jgi:hypothetical protein